MAARVVTVSPDLIWEPPGIQRLWFFPDGSQYLMYSPHFHIIYESGFRQNMPLCYMFIVVMEGKLSVKDFHGKTTQKIEIRDQVWYYRGSPHRARGEYAKMLPGRDAYTRSGR
jgi:hypothetical protein